MPPLLSQDSGSWSLEINKKASLVPAIGLPRLPRPFGSSSPIFMPIPAVVVLRLSLVLAWVATVSRSSSCWSENSTWFQAGDRAELLEGRFSMCKFESGSLLFRVARCIMDYAAGGVVGSLRSRVVDRLEGQREELEVGLGDLPLVERQTYGMLKESVEASHPQGGSGEDLFLLPEDLASLISRLVVVAIVRRPSSEMTTLPVRRVSHETFLSRRGNIGQVTHDRRGLGRGQGPHPRSPDRPELRRLQDSVDLRLDQSLEVCHRCDPFNEVFGAAELSDGALAGWFRLGSLRSLVRHASFCERRCLCARFILRVWGAGGAGPCGACSRLLRPLVLSGLRGMVPVLACSRFLQAGISGKLDRVSCSASAKGAGQAFTCVSRE